MRWGAMESPVRICLGATLVANLLLLSCTVSGNVLPSNSTARSHQTVTRDVSRTNNTFLRRHRSPEDFDMNELLQQKDVEDQTDKPVKLHRDKARGRVRYTKSSTATPLRRVRTTSTTTSTENPVTRIDNTPKLIIVTPTPEVKKPSQIIDSMMKYKRLKTSLTSKPLSTSKTEVKSEEEFSSEEHEEDEDNYEKFSTSKFDSQFYTIPSYNDNIELGSKGSEKKLRNDYSNSAYSTFSNYFPELGNANDNFNDHDEIYKSEGFFNFDEDLTTPKNEFFDKKHKQITQSIMKNLDYIKSKAQPPNATNIKIINENSPMEKLHFTVPTNKSTFVIKNTKEIRLLDNEDAGTNNKELSDIHGTSIYYEMSVLSTETYNIDRGVDDDCDNDAIEPTPSTSEEIELGSLNATKSTQVKSLKNQTTAEKSYPDPASESQNYFPFSTIGPNFFDSSTPVSYSAHNIISPTEKTTHTFSSFSRHRNYSKRLNVSGNKMSPNNVTPRPEVSSSRPYRGPTRRFHYTTPKTKPTWMAPRRNSTRNSYTRSTTPTTIFSEYFDITDKVSTSTPKPRLSSKVFLTTTVQPEIDPVLQTDIGGANKVVHSKLISDNSIPALWKRGSTKFNSSSATTTEAQRQELEIPPTLTAWALASLRSPPSMASMASSTQKSVDENELQKVTDISDKNDTTTSSTTTTTSTTTVNTINNDIISEKVTDIEQNRILWQPVIPLSTTSHKPENVTESKSVVPAESNISFQSSAKPSTTTKYTMTTTSDDMFTELKEWVSVEEKPSTGSADEMSAINITKPTGFESITKLPADLTTPHDETSGSNEQIVTEVPSTTDYEITTIRFSYVPTEAPETTETIASEKATETDFTAANPEKVVQELTTNVVKTTWHPVFPTRTKMSTIKDEEVTTYRPKYVTTTDLIDEPTTIVSENNSQAEVSSQLLNNITENIPVTTVSVELATEIPTEKPATTTDNSMTHIETTTMIVEIATEINTERGQATSTEIGTSSETSGSEKEASIGIKTSSSEENSYSNEVITPETTRTPSTTRSQVTEAILTPTEIITEPTTSSKPSTTEETKPMTTVTQDSEEVPSTTEAGTKSVNELEDLTSFNDEMTTEASSRVLADEAGTGVAIAIAVSTIGVIALILLIGLLLVVRRRGHRGVYAQRCTPVSLDAYSLDSVSVGPRKGNHRLRASKRSYGNPAFDDEVTSHPMQYAALANFALDIESMSAEFAEIPSVSVRPDEVPPGCEDKNRYSNVLPLPDTRVPLKRIGNDPTTEYINANFITGPGNIRNYYIACQAPMANTVVDFWRMIWEQNSRVLVMLTEYMENGVEKCYEYLPPSEISDNKRSFGDFQVILMKREQRDKYAVSSVQLINMATRTWREITHLWYFWPAKGVPEDYESVLDFLSEMRSYMKLSQTAKEYDEEGVEVIYGDQSRSSFHNLSKLRSDDSGSGNGVNVYSPSKAEEQMRKGNVTNGTLGRLKAASEVEGVRPCTVVCASGAGRSAALIAADICARALAAASADVPRVVREIRAQRPHSLSNRHHYIFLYKLLSEYGNKLMGGGVDTI